MASTNSVDNLQFYIWHVVKSEKKEQCVWSRPTRTYVKTSIVLAQPVFLELVSKQFEINKKF